MAREELDACQARQPELDPELEKRGFRGTFWVCGYYTEQGASAKVPRMTWDELREMSKKGHEVSSHSWAHAAIKWRDNLEGEPVGETLPEEVY